MLYNLAMFVHFLLARRSEWERRRRGDGMGKLLGYLRSANIVFLISEMGDGRRDTLGNVFLNSLRGA